jgi:hypothetical protein
VLGKDVGLQDRRGDGAGPDQSSPCQSMARRVARRLRRQVSRRRSTRGCPSGAYSFALLDCGQSPEGSSVGSTCTANSENR